MKKFFLLFLILSLAIYPAFSHAQTVWQISAATYVIDTAYQWVSAKDSMERTSDSSIYAVIYGDIGTARDKQQQCSTTAEPDHIHWGTTNNPLNGLTITWRDKTAGDSIRWGYTTSYERGSFAGIPRNDYEANAYLYDYTFPVVRPLSTIYYSINSDGLWGKDRTFQTSADTLSTHFTFIAGGDSRTYFGRWQKVANRLATESVDFHLFLGDHVTNGSSGNDWNGWYSNGINFIEQNLIYHTGGNHEYGSIYLNQFVMPGNEKWYSFEFGNAIFICLLTQEEMTAQYAWLLGQLLTTTKEWKFVFFHKPFFTTGGHAGDMDAYLNTWWKAFDDYGVDLIFNGHTHYYMRSKPINRNVSKNAPVSEYGSEPGQGRMQIIAGSYAPTTSTGTGWFIETTKAINHYCKIKINGDSLHMDAIDVNGNIFDQVTLVKKTTGINSNHHSKLSLKFKLWQNYPNPFNPQTFIKYQLKNKTKVTLEIYNILGRKIKTLVNHEKSAGIHSVLWSGKGDNGEDITAGVYFYKLQTKEFKEIKKLLYLK